MYLGSATRAVSQFIFFLGWITLVLSMPMPLGSSVRVMPKVLNAFQALVKQEGQSCALVITVCKWFDVSPSQRHLDSKSTEPAGLEGCYRHKHNGYHENPSLRKMFHKSPLGTRNNPSSVF